MSYDVEVFSIEKPIAPASEEGRGWQIAVDGPLNVEPVDIPAQVRALLPGLRFLTQFHFEGNASSSARKKLLSLARGLARNARGVVVDQQQGTVETPRGVQRLEMEPEGTGGGLLQLSWFVEDVDPLTRALPTEMLDLFSGRFPKSYRGATAFGSHRSSSWRQTGSIILRDFLAKNLRDTVVWYSHKPCQYVFISIPDRVGATPSGFRCGRLTLNIDGKAAKDHAWRVELTRLWLSVADLIQPFYAEIRTGECPTKSWWWNGIPTATPSALLIGKPYAVLWPDFVSAARSSGTGLHYLEHFAEAAADDVESRFPSPPVTIAQPPEPPRQTVFDPSKPEDMAAMFQPHKKLYPGVWPFEDSVSKI
jgi:hypothetical protein